MRGNERMVNGDPMVKFKATIPMRGNEPSDSSLQTADVISGYDPHEG